MAKKTISVKEQLDAQPKVLIMIPCTPGVAPEYDYRSVIVNGYRTRIKCGEYVEVAKTIADILSHSSAVVAKSRKAVEKLAAGDGVDLTAKEPVPEKG